MDEKLLMKILFVCPLDIRVLSNQRLIEFKYLL